MSMIRLTPFGGMTPRMGNRLLPNDGAQSASNVKIQSGELRPLRNPGHTYSPLTPKTNPAMSIFKARNGAASSAWFSWPIDVDCVRVPLAANVESLFCWTGDGPPKMATYTNAVSGGGDNYPLLANELSLGIPTPQTAPTVTPAGGVSATTVTRFYCYTFASAANPYLQESAPSPISAETTGKIDDTWALALLDEVPVNSGVANGLYSAPSTLITNTVNSAKAITGATNATPINITAVAHGYATGDKVVIKGVTGNTAANNTYANPYWTVTVTGVDNYTLDSSVGNAAYVAGGTSDKIARHWLRVGDEVTINSVTLTVATLPTAYTFTVAGDYSAYTTWARKTPWNTSGMTKRVYRTTGTTGTWELVNETGIAAATTTYNDTLTDAQIAGDELISDGWIPPPVGLTCLCVHPSGALCGLVGNLMCFSEPGQPHAWPEEYQLASGYNGIGMAVFGATVVMVTTGMPFVATGVEPASMTGEDVQGMYPGLSKRGVVSDGGSVLYPSKHGMVAVGVNGVSLFSDPWYTRDEWELLNPETMICAVANGRLYVAYTKDDGVGAMLIFDGSILVGVSVEATELYADVSSGELYLTTSEGIMLWDSSGEVPLQGNWRSKEWVFPKPINIGAGKIEFDLAISPDAEAALTAAIAAIEAANAVLLDDVQTKAVTITLANPAVCTSTAHGFVENTEVVFDTAGTLPASIVAGTSYYVLAAGLAANTFRISATKGGAAIDTSADSQAGAHTVIDMNATVGGGINDDAMNEVYINGSNIEIPPEAPPSNQVTVTLYSGDTVLASRVVSSELVFRLPQGYKKDHFSVEVTSQCAVKEIRLAETPGELRVA